MAHNCFIYETLNPVLEMQRSTENGLMTLSGVFGVCGVRNNNKRVYEKSNYAKCVKEMQNRIAENKGIPEILQFRNIGESIVAYRPYGNSYSNGFQTCTIIESAFTNRNNPDIIHCLNSRATVKCVVTNMRKSFSEGITS